MRTALAALLVVALVPALVTANASTWAVRTVLDGQAFTTTVGDALDTPALEAAIADAAAEVITEQIDELAPGVRAAAAQALGIGADVSDTQIRSWVDANILAALRSTEVRAERDEIVLDLHDSLLEAADGTGAVRVEGQLLVVDVGEVYDAAVTRLDPRAVQFARIAPGDATVVVARAGELAAVQQGLSMIRVLQLIIPLGVLVAILLILILAHRRVRALGIVGAVMMVAGIVSLSVAWVSGGVVAAIPDDPTAGHIAEGVYERFLTPLISQSLVLALGGAAVTVVAWIALRRGGAVSQAGSPG